VVDSALFPKMSLRSLSVRIWGWSDFISEVELWIAARWVDECYGISEVFSRLRFEFSFNFGIL